MILSIVNNKGGVGKTTTAVSLAAAFARQSYKTLLVDLDAQGSASLSLGIARADLSPSSAEVLLEGMPAGEAVRPTYVENLSILPGNMALASADLALSDVKGREAVLRNAIAPIRASYNYIILDCPPSLSLLAVNALTASDYFIIPMTPDYLALEGLVNLTEAVDRIRSGIGRVAELLGILLTYCDYRLNSTNEIIGMIRGHYGRKVFKTEIRGSVRLREAPSFGKTIFDFAPHSSGAEGYELLAREILKIIK